MTLQNLQRTRPPARLGEYRKSSYSGDGGGCVDVCHYEDETVGIRHSRHPANGEIRVSDAVFDSLVRSVMQDHLHRAGTSEEVAGRLRVCFLLDGGVAVEDTVDSRAPRMAFTSREIDAFRLGVNNGEFRRPTPAMS